MVQPPQPALDVLLSAVSNELVVRWDETSGGLTFTGNTTRYLGPSEASVPATFQELLERIRPEDRGVVEERFRRVLESPGRVFRCTFGLRLPADVTRQARTLTVESRTVEVVCKAISDRREDGASEFIATLLETPAEESLYRALAEYAMDVITLLAPDGTILYESPSVYRVLGYTPEELVGRNAFELMHPDDRSHVIALWERSLTQPGSVGEVGYRCLHADGSWRYLESTGRRPPANAVLEGTLIHSRDVTERRNLEQRLRDAREMEALGRLVAGIAHELNNLLTVIRGDAELLLQDLSDRGFGETEVREILDATRRGSHLTSDLLTYGRQETLQFEIIDVAEALRDAVSDLQGVLGEGIRLDATISDDPAWVRVDPAMARHVLFEVVSNAKEAMPDGGRMEIEVSTREVEDGSPLESRGLSAGRWISIRYQDTGKGMSPEVSARVFDPFFTTKDGHSGLGLSTVYGLVKQSGGEISIESAPGEGTTLWIYLPEAEGRMEAGGPPDDQGPPA